jgi:hypothetical protein
VAHELIVRIEIGEVVEDNERIQQCDARQEQRLRQARCHLGGLMVSNIRKTDLLFADIFIPYLRMRGDISFEQFPALAAVEVDYFDTIFAQPIEASSEGPAFSDDERSKAKLPYEAAAIPAGRKRGDHYEITIATVAPGTTERVGFPVDAGVALLHAAIMAAAHKFARACKDRCSDGDAAFGQPNLGLFQRHRQHPFV